MANPIKSKSKKDFSKQAQQTSEMEYSIKNYHTEFGSLKTKPGLIIYWYQGILAGSESEVEPSKKTTSLYIRLRLTLRLHHFLRLSLSSYEEDHSGTHFCNPSPITYLCNRQVCNFCNMFSLKHFASRSAKRLGGAVGSWLTRCYLFSVNVVFTKQTYCMIISCSKTTVSYFNLIFIVSTMCPNENLPTRQFHRTDRLILLSAPLCFLIRQ